MTSFGPIDMTDEQRAKLVASGDMTPDQSAQAAAERQKLVDLSSGAAPGYGTGKAVRGILGEALSGPAGINPNDNAAAFEQGAHNLGSAAWNGTVGVLGLPQSWAVQKSAADMPPTVPGTMPQQAPGQVPPALAPPQMAYGRHPGGGSGGGGGLYGIANEMKGLDKQSRANAADAETRLGKDFESIAGANQAVAKAEQDSAQAQADVFSAGLQQQRERDARDSQAHQQEQSSIDTSTNKYQTNQQAYAAMTVDPDRRYKEKGTSSKIGAGVAIALGALGASLAKGPNYALDIVNKAQDDDINAQLANIDKKDKELDREGQDLRTMRDSLGSNDRMRNLMRAQAWENTLNDMKAVDMSNKPAEIQAHAQASIAEAESRYNAAVAKVHGDVLDDARQNLVARGNVTASAESLGIQREQASTARAAAEAKVQKLPESVRAQLAKLDTAEANLKQISTGKPSAIAGALSKLAPWDTDADKYDRISMENMTDVRKSVTGEATNEADKRDIEKSRPQSTDSDATAADKLAKQQEKIRSARRAILRENGIDMPETSLAGL